MKQTNVAYRVLPTALFRRSDELSIIQYCVLSTHGSLIFGVKTEIVLSAPSR